MEIKFKGKAKMVLYMVIWFIVPGASAFIH